MSDPLLIPCPHCNGLNRIPATRLRDAPRCGRCKAEVLPAAPIELTQNNFASQLKGELPLLVDVWALVRPLPGLRTDLRPGRRPAAGPLPPGQAR